MGSSSARSVATGEAVILLETRPEEGLGMAAGAAYGYPPPPPAYPYYHPYYHPYAPAPYWRPY